MNEIGTILRRNNILSELTASNWFNDQLDIFYTRFNFTTENKRLFLANLLYSLDQKSPNYLNQYGQLPSGQAGLVDQIDSYYQDCLREYQEYIKINEKQVNEENLIEDEVPIPQPPKFISPKLADEKEKSPEEVYTELQAEDWFNTILGEVYTKHKIGEGAQTEINKVIKRAIVSGDESGLQALGNNPKLVELSKDLHNFYTYAEDKFKARTEITTEAKDSVQSVPANHKISQIRPKSWQSPQDPYREPADPKPTTND